MKLWYYVTFQYSENIFCVNFAYGEYEDVSKKYSSYKWFNLQECDISMVAEGREKGIPVIRL